jgi:hypothetical protein
MSRKSLLWLLAALSGIALTAGITWAASQLASQRIGLSSEPLSASGQLAPGYVATRPSARSPSVPRATYAPQHVRTAAPRANPLSSAAPQSVAVAPPPATSVQAPPGAAAPPIPSPRPLPTAPAASGSRSGEDSKDRSSGGTAGKLEAGAAQQPSGAGSGHGPDD